MVDEKNANQKLALAAVGEGEWGCPSTIAQPGAHLFGVVSPDGSVSPIFPSLEIDQAFINAAQPYGPLEGRFRFAGRCIEEECRQWTGSRCGVIERVIDALRDEIESSDEPIQRCAVRTKCRWFHQRGPAACRACKYVVTDGVGCGPPLF